MDLSHVIEDSNKTSTQVNTLLRARHALATQTYDDLGTVQIVTSALAKLDHAIVDLHNATLLLERVGLEDELLGEYR